MMKKTEMDNIFSLMNKEKRNKQSNNSSGSFISLNIPSSKTGLESLNLIDIKNKKFVRPKTEKFNIIKNNKNEIEKPPKPTQNLKIKYFQNIIFFPIITF